VNGLANEKLITETDYDIQDIPIRTIDPNGFNDDGTRNGRFQSTTGYTFMGKTAWAESPDAGRAEMIYDRYGRLRFSRDANQAVNRQFNYTAYDERGRAVEEGYGNDELGRWSQSRDGYFQQTADQSKSWPRGETSTWRKRYFYDDIGEGAYTKGKLMRVEVNNDDSADVDVLESFVYENGGERVSTGCRYWTTTPSQK
jgi:hypothetical protein